VFRRGGFRFYFFSREELRIHVHVQHAEGEAKFWLEPEIELAQSWGLNTRRIKVSLPPVSWTPRIARKCGRSVAWQDGNDECSHRRTKPRS